MDEEYTQVDQKWIDRYIDEFEYIKDDYGKNIVFYRKENGNPIQETLNNIFRYKSKWESHGYHQPQTSVPGRPLFIKNEDYDYLQKYIDKRDNERKAIRDAKTKKNEEDSEENKLNQQNVALNNEPPPDGCIGNFCKTVRNAFKRDATINPTGGKRTRKQKKTRKHKKAHRKMIHKKK